MRLRAVGCEFEFSRPGREFPVRKGHDGIGEGLDPKVDTLPPRRERPLFDQRERTSPALVEQEARREEQGELSRINLQPHVGPATGTELPH